MKSFAWNKDPMGAPSVDISPVLIPRYTIKFASPKGDQYFWRLPGNIRFELFIPIPDVQSRTMPEYSDFLIDVMNGLNGLEKQVHGQWGMIFVKKGEEKNLHIYIWVEIFSDAEQIRSFFHSIYSKFLSEYSSTFDTFFHEISTVEVSKGYPYIPIYVSNGRSFLHLSKFNLALSEKLPLIPTAEYQGIPLKKGLIMENVLLHMSRINDPGIVAIFTMTFKSGHIKFFGDRHYEARLKSADYSSMYSTYTGELNKATSSNVASLLHKNYMEKIDSPYHFITKINYMTIAVNEKTLLKYPHELIFNSINGFFTQMGNYFKQWTFLEQDKGKGKIFKNSIEWLTEFFGQEIERKLVGGEVVFSPKELSYFFIYPSMDLFNHACLINIAGMRSGMGSEPATPVQPYAENSPSDSVTPPVFPAFTVSVGGSPANENPSPTPSASATENVSTPNSVAQAEDGVQNKVPEQQNSSSILSSNISSPPEHPFEFHESRNIQINPIREVNRIILTPSDSPAQLVYNIKQGTPVHGIAIGSTGSGKSSELVNIFLQLVKDRNASVFYLDPFGKDIMDSIIPNLSEEELKRVVMINPDDPDLIVGMNIMAPQELALVQSEQERIDLEERIKSRMNYQGAVLQKIGDDLFETLKYITESTSGTGTAYAGARILTNITKGIKVVGMWRNANLVDLSYLFTFKNSRQKLKSMMSTTDITTQGFLELLSQYKPDELHSTVRLIDSITDSDALRRILCTRNFKASMLKFINEKKIVLITAGANTTQNSMRVLLSSMISMIYVAGTSPERDPTTSIYIFADEFQEYANSSLKLILDIGRKWAISLFLATTSFSGIKNTALRSSILANAQIRMLFRLGDDDRKYFRGDSQLIDQNSGTLPPFLMIAKTPDLKYGIYKSFSLPSTQKTPRERALEIIKKNIKQYVVSDDTRESPLFDPNDMFVEIAMVLLHAEGRYIAMNNIRESDPRYLDKGFATIKEMGNAWSILAQYFPDVYSPIDNRSLYTKLMQGVQRSIFSQRDFADGKGKEMSYVLTPKGELFLMEWLGGASAGKDMHRMLVIKAIKYLTRKKLLVRLIKQVGIATSDLEAIAPAGTIGLSELDKKFFAGKDHILVEIEENPTEIVKKILRGKSSNSFVLFIVKDEN
ncbi:MAG: hypothetical protein ACP5T9_03925, partial [Thermoplasmata archaeon]